MVAFLSCTNTTVKIEHLMILLISTIRLLTYGLINVHQLVLVFFYEKEKFDYVSPVICRNVEKRTILCFLIDESETLTLPSPRRWHNRVPDKTRRSSLWLIYCVGAANRARRQSTGTDPPSGTGKAHYRRPMITHFVSECFLFFGKQGTLSREKIAGFVSYTPSPRPLLLKLRNFLLPNDNSVF